jgi:apolipoprotein N-acyltransferase
MASSIQATAAAPVPTPKPVAPPLRQPRALVLLLSALATGGLLWLSYFPVNCGWLAWFALVPFLTLVRTTVRPRFVYFCAWLGGLAFYLPALQWMRVADPRMYFTWIGLALYCSLYFPLGLFFVRFLDRRTRLPLVLTLPVVWTALEFFRSWFCTGFSWYLLGHTQHDCLPLIQIADLTGAYGVSFLVAAVNAVLFEALYRWQWFRTRFAGPDAPAPQRPFAVAVQAAVVAAVLLAAVGYGAWRLSQDAFTPGPRIALVQGSVPQQIRNDLDQVGLTATHFAALCDLASRQEHKPDLIVWPETSFPDGWCDAEAGAPPQALADWQESVTKSRSGVLDLVTQSWGTNMLLGLNSVVLESDGRKHIYNSALLVDRGGKPAGRYDKMHCVPFGEYVPLRDWFPWMKYIAPYDFDYSVTPGRQTTHFPLSFGPGRGYSFGVAICYEDTDPDRTRPYAGADGKPPVDFLLNISNDGWFDGTSEHDEHLAICRFRAVECRRSVGRAVNMGVSAVIDADGRVLVPRPVEGTEWDRADVRAAIEERANVLSEGKDRTTALELFPSDHKAAVWLASPPPGGESLPAARWAEFKKVPCVLLADVPIDHRVSLYALWGDWLAWGCWGLLGVGVILGIVRRRAAAPIPSPSRNRT